MKHFYIAIGILVIALVVIVCLEVATVANSSGEQRNPEKAARLSKISTILQVGAPVLSLAVIAFYYIYKHGTSGISMAPFSLKKHELASIVVLIMTVISAVTLEILTVVKTNAGKTKVAKKLNVASLIVQLSGLVLAAVIYGGGKYLTSERRRNRRSARKMRRERYPSRVAEGESESLARDIGRLQSRRFQDPDIFLPEESDW